MRSLLLVLLPLAPLALASAPAAAPLHAPRLGEGALSRVDTEARGRAMASAVRG